MQENQAILRAVDDNNAEKMKTFKYDKCYWSFDKKSDKYADQEQVFKDLGLPLLNNAFLGFNNCIFAYGQTGSGKSYSMMGSREDPGLIPRICESLFNRISELSSQNTNKYTVEVSYLEIYNERVRDLLNPKNKSNLRVREHPSLGPYVEDLSRLAVSTFEDIENLMDEGNKARTIAATNMNETSSRSHAVFTIILTEKVTDGNRNIDTEKVSRISLVDLAGSERASSTGATGHRLKEGTEINKSLSSLGRVIRSLADISSGKRSKDIVVPYRDSALTWLLKDSLGGNSMTAMIATISPADINYDETLSTLRYADSAKRIKNHAVVNEDPNTKMIRELKSELLQLRNKLKSGDITHPSGEDKIVITSPDGTVKEVTRAELAEQLNSSEKLLKEMNQTWEERLAKTHEIQMEREAALEELGISLDKGFVGLHTPKTTPYLVNLSDDPLLAECLMYNIKPGSTLVGNADSATKAQIRLHGSRILVNHCTFENYDGAVTIVPYENAAIIVNGLRVTQSHVLHSGDRVILGNFHIFRFNDPQEVLKERGKSRHDPTRRSVLNVADIDDGKYNSNNQSPSSDQISTNSSMSGPGALPYDDTGDWTLARLEAAKSFLGPDTATNISQLTDEELDRLFEQMQRVRSIRRGRPDSAFDQYSDSDSFMSLSPSPVSLRTQQRPTSPLQFQIGLQDFATDDPFIAYSPGYNTDGIRSKLNQIKTDMKDKLEAQAMEFELRLRESVKISSPQLSATDDSISPPISSTPKFIMKRKPELSTDEKKLARKCIAVWRRNSRLKMSETIYRYALLLREAQILSNKMNRDVRFQFTVVDEGFNPASSYDLVMNNAEPEEDEALAVASKPCIGIRVMDYQNQVVKIISIEKLMRQVQACRNIYNESPMYSELHGLEYVDPFSGSFTQKYTHVGDAYIPMSGVLKTKTPTGISTDIISPYTLSVIGLVRLTLEPSTSTEPEKDKDRTTFSIITNLDSIVGFSEVEFSEVHVQIFWRQNDNSLYPGGISTSQMVSGFGDGAVVFNSSHVTKVGNIDAITLDGDYFDDPPVLQLKVFAKISQIHLEKLISWDDMQESLPQSRKPDSPTIDKAPAVIQHDAFVQIQVLEPADNGIYEAVDIVRVGNEDKGVMYLHIGVQKRIHISITHSSGDSFDWSEIMKLSVDDVRLVDADGNIRESQSKINKVDLRLIGKPRTIANSDGTRTITVTGQWDSSAHSSIFLDLPTADRQKIVFSLNWYISTPSVMSQILFTSNIVAIMLPRSAKTPSWISLVMASSKITHAYTAIFEVCLRLFEEKHLEKIPLPDLSLSDEDDMGDWRPRGLSLVKEFYESLHRRRQYIELEATHSVIDFKNLPVFRRSEEITEDQKVKLKRAIDLWKSSIHPGNSSDMDDESSTPSQLHENLKYFADVRQVKRNSRVSKFGFVWMPDFTMRTWEKRYVELRRPYIHIYDVSRTQELSIINISQCKIDHQPELISDLQRPNVFAILTENTIHLLNVKTRAEMGEWIMHISQSGLSNEVYAMDEYT
ncbi:hypothetical protein V1511DRAFT_461141 [Dipodascopsis uninucleata]